MDAFFASVEVLHHPEWRGRPLVVGSGPHERGVVSTCSYEARRFGVRSAMPSRTAYQLCPHAIFTPPHMALYREVSDRVFEIFGRFTPFVEGVSIDEAFLDVTGSLHFYGAEANAESRIALGEALRSAVRRECGVTCSVGIAPNRLLAKIGSEQRKPDGLTLMPFDKGEVAAFLAPKPVSVLWGVGKKTVAALAPYGIRTCGDVQRMPLERLATVLGSRSGAVSLREYAFGICDDTVHTDDAEEKTVSREHTFDEDTADSAVVREKLLELVVDVGLRCRKRRRWARTARLKLRDAEFRTTTRQMPFEAPVRDDMAFRRAALELWGQTVRECRAKTRCRFPLVRLIGFGVANFTDAPDGGQLALVDDPADERRRKRERLSDALDALRSRDLI